MAPLGLGVYRGADGTTVAQAICRNAAGSHRASGEAGLTLNAHASLDGAGDHGAAIGLSPGGGLGALDLLDGAFAFEDKDPGSTATTARQFTQCRGRY